MGDEHKRALLAVVLSGLVLLGWQMFFAPPSTLPVSQVPLAPKVSSENVGKMPMVDQQGEKTDVKEIGDVSLAVHSLAGEFAKIKIRSDLTLEDFQAANQKFTFQQVLGDKAIFRLLFSEDGQNFRPVIFNFVENSDKHFSGKNDQLGITLLGELTKNDLLTVNIQSNRPYRYKFNIHTESAKLENQTVREFVAFGKDVTRVSVDSNKYYDGNFKWFGVDFNYHLFAIIFQEKQNAKLLISSSEHGNNPPQGDLWLETLSENSNFTFSYLFTKKDYDYLISLGNNLQAAVNFGFFGIVAVPILRGLQMFYRWVENYGMAIILLTILIRFITFPLQYKSFKSMKKMQLIQPELNKLKEKYKDEPQKFQKESLEFMKKSGANPLGGCFPILLQMPVFFAFYTVLGNAVELVGAPFIWWIHDLSHKDPYYILPVLVAVSFFVQQKLTPTTITDPTQQKIMLFMPILFAFFMKDLPSGLNLYIFVSTLMGMGQQFLVNKIADR